MSTIKAWTGVKGFQESSVYDATKVISWNWGSRQKSEAKLNDDSPRETEQKVNGDEKEPRRWFVRAHWKSQTQNIFKDGAGEKMKEDVMCKPHANANYKVWLRKWIWVFMLSVWMCEWGAAKEEGSVNERFSGEREGGRERERRRECREPVWRNDYSSAGIHGDRN